MAKANSHITFSVLLGIGYCLFGIYGLEVYPEHAMLALAIIIIAGMLPDIDSRSGAPARELGAVFAAIAPIMLLEYFPGLKEGGMARIALVVIACYLFTRVFVIRGLQKITVQQGMIHSIPAAIITFELAYLLFYDMYWADRLYVSLAAFLGFLAHLFLDASTNFDLIGKAMGEKQKRRPVLKLISEHWGANAVAYSCLFGFGWMVAQELVPHLRDYGVI